MPTETTFTPEQILERYYAFKQGQSHPGRSSATRASSLGHPCTVYPAWERLAGEQASLPDRTLSCVFAEGRLQESGVLSDFREMGLPILEQQRTVYWDQFEIAGHIDGWLYANGERKLVEVKSCSPFAFAKFNSIDDIKSHKAWYYRKWPAQLTVYMLLEAVDSAWFILKNKATGELKILPMTLDYEYAESLIKKAENIKWAVHALQYNRPDSHIYVDFPNWLKKYRLNDPDVCNECPFKAVCLPEIDAGPGAGIITDPEMPDKIKRHQELKPLTAEYDELHEEIKSAAERLYAQGHTTIICGDWALTGKQEERKGKKFWKTSIAKIGKGE